jgi:DNA-binding NarL/FixJ family response regulator
VQILGDIVKGFSNIEITQRRSLSINSVKSYIRATYRKLGVTSRSQAVSWGLQHGFEQRDHRPEEMAETSTRPTR